VTPSTASTRRPRSNVCGSTLADFLDVAEARLAITHVSASNDQKSTLSAQDLAALEGPKRTLQLGASDLRDHIKRKLNDRLSESRRHYQIALWIIVPSGVVGLLVMTGLMRSFYAWVFNPIRDLEAGVKHLAQGRFSHVIEVNSGDEMQDLARAFNDMSRPPRRTLRRPGEPGERA